MDRQEIVARRLAAQHLIGPALDDPVAVVRHFGAMQAQEYPMARWSVGQRTTGVDDAALRQTVDSGAIVRLHALRPTWHFIAADDVGWIQALTAPRVHALNRYYYRQHGMDDRTTARTTRTLTTALADGPLTRAEVAKWLGANGNKLAYLIMHAELAGLVGNGPMQGKQHTYALLPTPSWQPDPDDALAELTRRYFTSHGPATAKDYAWWSSLTATDIRRALTLIDIETAEVDGLRFHYVPGPVVTESGLHILQPYDEYVVAYTESRSVTGIGAEGTLAPTIVRDGQVIGTWRRSTGRGTIHAQPTMTVRLTAALRRSIEVAFARYGAFADVPVTVDWSARSSGR